MRLSLESIRNIHEIKLKGTKTCETEGLSGGVLPNKRLSPDIFLKMLLFAMWLVGHVADLFFFPTRYKWLFYQIVILKQEEA